MKAELATFGDLDTLKSTAESKKKVSVDMALIEEPPLARTAGRLKLQNCLMVKEIQSQMYGKASRGPAARPLAADLCTPLNLTFYSYVMF